MVEFQDSVKERACTEGRVGVSPAVGRWRRGEQTQPFMACQGPWLLGCNKGGRKRQPSVSVMPTPEGLYSLNHSSFPCKMQGPGRGRFKCRFGKPSSPSPGHVNLSPGSTWPALLCPCLLAGKNQSSKGSPGLEPTGCVPMASLGPEAQEGATVMDQAGTSSCHFWCEQFHLPTCH